MPLANVFQFRPLAQLFVVMGTITEDSFHVRFQNINTATIIDIIFQLQVSFPSYLYLPKKAFELKLWFLFLSGTLVRLMDTNMILWHFLNTRTFLAIRKLLLTTNTVYRTSIMAGMYSFHSSLYEWRQFAKSSLKCVSSITLSLSQLFQLRFSTIHSIIFLNQLKLNKNSYLLLL